MENDVWGDRAKLFSTLVIGSVIACGLTYFLAVKVDAKLDKGLDAQAEHAQSMNMLATAFALHDRESNSINMRILNVVRVMCVMNANGDRNWIRECNQ